MTKQTGRVASESKAKDEAQPKVRRHYTPEERIARMEQEMADLRDKAKANQVKARDRVIEQLTKAEKHEAEWATKAAGLRKEKADLDVLIGDVTVNVVTDGDIES